MGEISPYIIAHRLSDSLIGAFLAFPCCFFEIYRIVLPPVEIQLKWSNQVVRLGELGRYPLADPLEIRSQNHGEIEG